MTEPILEGLPTVENLAERTRTPPETERVRQLCALIDEILQEMLRRWLEDHRTDPNDAD